MKKKLKYLFSLICLTNLSSFTFSMEVGDFDARFLKVEIIKGDENVTIEVEPKAQPIPEKQGFDFDADSVKTSLFPAIEKNLDSIIDIFNCCEWVSSDKEQSYFINSQEKFRAIKATLQNAEQQEISLALGFLVSCELRYEEFFNFWLGGERKASVDLKKDFDHDCLSIKTEIEKFCKLMKNKNLQNSLHVL